MRRSVFLMVILALLLLGCTDIIKGKSIAEPKVAVFHDRFNEGQYEEIYSEAADEFKKAASKEKVLALFSAIDSKLGKVQSSSITTWNVKNFNLNTTVVLVSDTQFELGAGTETFTFLVNGEKAALLGYNINSMDMMTR